MQNPRNNDANKVPLWIIAFSLLTIAVCLVALVLRPNTASRSELETSNVESPRPEVIPAQTRPARSANPARAASIAQTIEPGNLEPLVVSPATQTVVQTSQTIVITPPLRGLALGAHGGELGDTATGQGMFGTIIGRVTLQGEPPPEKVFDVPASVACEHLREHPPTTHNYVVGTNRGLANVYLQLVPAPATELPVARATNTVTLTFTNCDLQPYLIVVARHDRLVVRNLSPTKHILRFGRQELTSIARSFPVEPGQVIFPLESQVLSSTEMGMLTAYCILHEWEQTRLASPIQPQFTVTDSSGHFAFSNVPPYFYHLEAYHESSPVRSGRPNGTSPINLFAGATEVRTLPIYPYPRR